MNLTPEKCRKYLLCCAPSVASGRAPAPADPSSDGATHSSLRTTITTVTAVTAVAAAMPLRLLCHISARQTGRGRRNIVAAHTLRQFATTSPEPQRINVVSVGCVGFCSSSSPSVSPLPGPRCDA